MDVFNRNHRGFIIVERLNILKLVYVALFCFSTAYTASAQDKEKVAVLPFVIDAQGTPDNLATSLQNQFNSSLSEKGIQVITADSVNKHPLAFQKSLGDNDLISIGKDLGAAWVVSGIFTKQDNKNTLNIKVTGLGTNNKASFPITAGVENLDLLSDAVKGLTEKIDYTISGISFVSSIQVKGNKRIESDAILAIIDTKKGDRYDEASLNQDVRTIYNMGYFKDVQVEKEDDANGKTITFIVEEKPYITKIAFEGNKEYKDDKLTGEIGIKNFAVLNLSEVKQSINKLKEFYKKNGYYKAAITEKIEELPNNESVLTYVINEGEKVYITKIEFVGNEVYDDDDLIDLMKTNTKGFFYWLTSSGVFEKAKLEYDVAQLTSFYHNQGYIEARFGEPEVTYDEKTGLTITISIIEGKRYKVGDVHFEGDLIKPENELLAKININKQEYFSTELLYKDKDVLKNIYADDGYANTEVSAYPKEDEVNLKVNTTFQINKNKKVRIERININGNTNTRDKVIRREMKLVEGDYFSSSKLEKSKENLVRLEYLEDELEIKSKQGSSDDLMVVDVNVAEKNTGTFSMGAGYSGSYYGVFASLGVTIDNLFGRGQSVSLSGQLSKRSTEYNLTFVEPWILDKPVSGSINLFDWETDYDDFTKKSKGVTLGVGFLLGIDDYTRASISYSYDDAYVSSTYSYYSQTLQDMIGQNVKNSITAGIGRDSRDVYFMTNKGSLNSLSVEYAGGLMGGDASFNKYSLVSAWYIPVWWNNVLLVRGSAGLVQRHSDGKLPIYEKYMLGGSDAVRGYDYQSISPKDTTTGESIGGEKMWLGSIEYRIPIRKKEGVLGLLFFDAGNAYRKDESWKLRAKRSYGFGLRWKSPMGNIRLEYSFPLDKEPGESYDGFEFNMGGTF